MTVDVGALPLAWPAARWRARVGGIEVPPSEPIAVADGPVTVELAVSGSSSSLALEGRVAVALNLRAGEHAIVHLGEIPGSEWLARWLRVSAR